MAQANVFEQIIKLIPRREFQRTVSRFDGDRKVTQLNCWSWFGALLFGQMTGHDSIRAIERAFGYSSTRMKRLGFSEVCRSTLADANHTRPLAILEETYKGVLKQAHKLAPKNDFRFKGDVLALDGTIIDLCLSLSPWANFRRGTAGIKLHTAIDIAGDLPDFVVITPARRNEIPIAKQYFHPKPGTTVLIDRGYWDSQWLSQLNTEGVYLVTRQRKNQKFRVKQSRQVDRTQGYICDQIVYQLAGSNTSSQPYKGRLRRISYKDPKTKKKLTFLTNRFDLATSTICALYKARWKVELFFKTLKQNLRVKKFLGTSAHAVKAQILVALIAYVLVQIFRFKTKTHISIPDAMAVVGTLLLLREPLERLLGRLPRVTRYPPSYQLVLDI